MKEKKWKQNVVCEIFFVIKCQFVEQEDEQFVW